MKIMMNFTEIFMLSSIGIVMVLFPGPIRKAMGNCASLLIAFQIREDRNQVKKDLMTSNPIFIRILGGVCLVAAFVGLIVRVH